MDTFEEFVDFSCARSGRLKVVHINAHDDEVSNFFLPVKTLIIFAELIFLPEKALMHSWVPNRSACFSL